MTKYDPRILFLFALVILSWGLSWPVTKIGLLYMTPLWYTTTRLIIGTLSMTAIVVAIGKFSVPTLRECPLIAIIGLLQISLFMLFANIGLAYLPAGRASLLAYTTPLWVMPIAAFVLHESVGILRWIGFALGIGGLMLLLSPWEMNWLDTNVIIGASMLLLGSLGWAISMLCVRYMKWTKSPLELIPWQLLLGTVPILLLAIVKEPAPHIIWTWQLLLSLVYTGILVTGISYWLGVIVNKELPTIIVSVGFLLVPVLSLFISAIWMGEAINLPTSIAIASILLGLLFVIL